MPTSMSPIFSSELYSIANPEHPESFAREYHVRIIVTAARIDRVQVVTQ
jgi:hypothetical protein